MSFPFHVRRWASAIVFAMAAFASLSPIQAATLSAVTAVVDPLPASIVKTPATGSVTATSIVAKTVTASTEGSATYTYASAKYDPSNAKSPKTTSTLAYVKAGHSASGTALSATASISGTQYVVPVNPGQLGSVVELNYSFPASDDLTVVGAADPNYQNSVLNAFGVPAPLQGFIRNNANLTTTQIGSLLDLNYSIAVSVNDTAIGSPQTLFVGSAVFHGDGTLTTSGNFGTATLQPFRPDPLNHPGVLENQLPTVAPLTFPVNVGFPFELDVVITTSMGNSGLQTFPSGLPPSAGGLGAGSSFTSLAPYDPTGVNSVSTVQTLVPGDFNGDGQVDASDVSAMMQALVDLKSYEALYHITDAQLLTIGDLDGNHKVTNADLQGLLNTLANTGGGGAMATAVPEPSSILLAAVCCTAIGIVYRRRTFQMNLN